ncbi:MAG: PAS domain-containing protein [Proteobacteria bacterium]|nr:PAS domain-containing protein [Pseudomonadota bacterium]
MPRATVPVRRLTLAVAALSVPVVVTLVVLVALGEIEAGVAGLAGLVILAGLAVPVRRHLASLAALGTHVDALADQGATATAQPAQPAQAGSTAELSWAIGRLKRSLERKSGELEARVGAGEIILDSLPDPLIMLDDGLRIVRANLAARNLLDQNLGGRDLAAVLRNPAVLEAAQAVLAGAAGRTVEFTLPGRIERTLRARIEPLSTRAADGTAAVLALHDLTAAKRSEQMRADFIANASHELRTPLSTLIGYIETLSGTASEDAEARQRFLGIMHDQASRMSGLVDDLLSLSRIELHEHSPPDGRVDLATVLKDVADTLALDARAKGMTIALDLPPAAPAVVGDGEELIQVFQNLVDNAIKYGRPNSTVTAKVTRTERGPGPLSKPSTEGVVVVAISDQGAGIAREHLPRLTERFYRVDAARSRELGGTGLGLAIVKHILNHHRGALTIESQAGKGSTFTVYLAATPPAGRGGA